MMNKLTGNSRVWSLRLAWNEEIAGSNPASLIYLTMKLIGIGAFLQKKLIGFDSRHGLLFSSRKKIGL
jgi:hypothetical protein